MTMSPLLQHALESFEHSVEHYIKGSNTDRKFAILHIDHAIELILKEKLRDMGLSIYKRSGETLNIHGCFKNLGDNGVKVIERADLELLHDDRNAIQHKGFTPDQNATKFGIEKGYSFFKRFLKEELNISIGDVLPQRFIELIEGKPTTPKNKIDGLILSAEGSLQRGEFTNAILSSSIALELHVRRMIEKSNLKPHQHLLHIFKDLEKVGLVSKKDLMNLQQIYHIRSEVIHTAKIATANDAKYIVTFVRKFVEKY